jgi:hypothetical protein
MPRAHGQDLSRALQGHMLERSGVSRGHGQDLSRALQGHRVERSCAVDAWPGSL